MTARTDHDVDVVVVAYNSRPTLRGCVEPLAGVAGVRVIVVDNASRDGSAESVASLRLTLVRSDRNGGFAYGCNLGWRAGRAPAVLFLNPDARIEPDAVQALAAALAGDGVGAVAPRIHHEDGSIDHSIRRFPRLRSTYAKALFLHRLVPQVTWADEVVRDPRRYEVAGPAEWVSGACVMVRRPVLELLDGWDEGFFLYCEDTDLCRRIWDSGYSVRFEPTARSAHLGGRSAPRASLLPVHAASRVRYASKHSGALAAGIERLGIGIDAAARVAVGRGGMTTRRAYARSLGVVLSSAGGRAGQDARPT